MTNSLRCSSLFRQGMARMVWHTQTSFILSQTFRFSGPSLVTTESHKEHMQHLNICPSASSIRARESSLRHRAEISSFDISKEKLILAPNLHSTHINKAQEGRAMWPNSFPSPAESCEPLHLRQVSEGSLCAMQITAEQNRRPHTAPAHALWKYNTPHFLILYITKTSPTSNSVTNSTAFHLTSGSNIFMEMKSKLIARNFFPPF